MATVTSEQGGPGGGSGGGGTEVPAGNMPKRRDFLYKKSRQMKEMSSFNTKHRYTVGTVVIQLFTLIVFFLRVSLFIG